MVSSVGEKLHCFWLKNWRGEIDGAMHGLKKCNSILFYLISRHIVHACTYNLPKKIELNKISQATCQKYLVDYNKQDSDRNRKWTWSGTLIQTL